MQNPDSDPNETTEADVADVLEQAEPLAAEPVEEALARREAIDARDPELTGEEAEEAEDSGQA
jgi:hypothetical protein